MDKSKSGCSIVGVSRDGTYPGQATGQGCIYFINGNGIYNIQGDGRGNVTFNGGVASNKNWGQK